MLRFKIAIRFKNQNFLEIPIDTENDLRDEIPKEWARFKKDGAIRLGDYVISIDDILYMKIGSEDEEHSG